MGMDRGGLVSHTDDTSGNATGRGLSAVRAGRRYLPAPAVRALADEVVVRLADRLHRHGTVPSIEVSVDAFCDALQSRTIEDAVAMIDQERRDGVSVEAIYLQTLAGAARHLGVMWEQDRITFLAMTVAIGRIFEIMRRLRQEVPAVIDNPASRTRAYLTTVPGESHTLGLTMAASLLRRRGWSIELHTGLDHEALLANIESADQRIIGLAAARPESLVPLVRLIIAVRIVRPLAKIVITGSIVRKVEGLAELTGADLVIPDDDEAIDAFAAFADELD